MHLFIIYVLVVDASCQDRRMEPVKTAVKNSNGLFQYIALSSPIFLVSLAIWPPMHDYM